MLKFVLHRCLSETARFEVRNRHRLASILPPLQRRRREKVKRKMVRPRALTAGISAGCILLVLALLASATRTPDPAQAMPAEQPGATATVEARQTMAKLGSGNNRERTR